MMKLFINHFPQGIFEEKLKDLSHLDFSLFIDARPSSQDDLSSINILVLQEPNGYFGHSDWAIQNKDLFSLILTWDQRVLNNCSNATFLGFGHTWFKPEQYVKNHDKKYQISHLCGVLLKTYGQSLRHEILSRENEILGIPKKFYHTYGDRNNIERARIDKEEIFGDSQYGIAIENFSHMGYFSEKILDCFLLKTIPIYWGCSNIGDFFNKDGIIQFNNVDDLITKVNKLDELTYHNNWTQSAVNENYQLALKYVDYAQNIVDSITNILTLNKII